jgi:hypothetical protein
MTVPGWVNSRCRMQEGQLQDHSPDRAQLSTLAISSAVDSLPL